MILDDPTDVEARARVLAFLEKVQAADVIHLNLDAEAKVLGRRGRSYRRRRSAVFVFDRDNRIALKMVEGEAAVDYAVIEKKVQELLKK